MATIPISMLRPTAAPPSEVGQPLHRLRTVRLQQGVSLRSVARQTRTDIRQLRLQEQESTDLRLSDIRKWQKALDVPLTELIVETDEPLSRPVMERARMVKLMKTAAAILERADSDGTRRMAQMMVDQLLEIMPELEDVSPWHNYGQRRSLEEFGAVVDRSLSDDLLETSYRDD